MKVSTVLIFAFAIAALVYLGLKWWQVRDAGAGPVGEAAQLARGAALYAENCEGCHGVARAAANGAPDLRLFAKSKDQFRETIFAGFYPMPSFEGELSEADIDALWAYVSSPAEASPSS